MFSGDQTAVTGSGSPGYMFDAPHKPASSLSGPMGARIMSVATDAVQRCLVFVQA